MIAAEVKYKKTGIDWMPEVPEHWEIVRLKNVTKIVSGATPKSSVSANWNGNINWVTPAEFGDEMYIGESVRKITKTGLESCAAALVPVGSIILSNRAPIGSLGISKVELCTNQGCKSIIPTQINNYFLYFLMTLQKENLNVLGNGTTFRELATPSLRNYKIPLPPKEEQDIIAKYLFDENEKITRFIQTKQRFIELLKEQRQSIITNAVTKGIDDGVKMKETGIDWMPEVPEHWEIRRLKNLATKIQTGSTPKSEDSKFHFDGGETNWFTPGDIKDFFVSSSNRKVTERAIKDGAVELYPEKTLLVVGIGATLGKVTMITEKGGSNQQINAVILNNDLVAEFGLFFLSSFESVLKSISNASTLAILTQSDLKGMFVAFPPNIEEQKRIVEHIKTETRTLDIAISKAEREIELIKEYREAMIAEAVTGKMKL